MRATLRRELRVAFSRRAQPAWFRVVKWCVTIVLTALFWRKPAFWWCIAGLLTSIVPVHVLYHWKTRNWTRPWGGWNDPNFVDEANAEAESEQLR